MDFKDKQLKNISSILSGFIAPGKKNDTSSKRCIAFKTKKNKAHFSASNEGYSAFSTTDFSGEGIDDDPVLFIPHVTFQTAVSPLKGKVTIKNKNGTLHFKDEYGTKTSTVTFQESQLLSAMALDSIEKPDQAMEIDSKEFMENLFFAADSSDKNGYKPALANVLFSVENKKASFLGALGNSMAMTNMDFNSENNKLLVPNRIDSKVKTTISASEKTYFWIGEKQELVFQMTHDEIETVSLIRSSNIETDKFPDKIIKETVKNKIESGIQYEISSSIFSAIASDVIKVADHSTDTSKKIKINISEYDIEMSYKGEIASIEKTMRADSISEQSNEKVDILLNFTVFGQRMMKQARETEKFYLIVSKEKDAIIIHNDNKYKISNVLPEGKIQVFGVEKGE